TDKTDSGLRVGKCKLDASADYPVDLLFYITGQAAVGHDAPQRDGRPGGSFPIIAKVHHLIQPFVLISKAVFMYDESKVDISANKRLLYVRKHHFSFVGQFRKRQPK